MSEKVCDHASVGMLVWNKDKLLLIERRKPQYGFAPPAGHVDGDTNYEKAAIRELLEEVGLQATKLSLVLEKDKDNPCRREDGTWHHWKVYEVHTANTEIKRSEDETRQAGWYTRDEIRKLAMRTERYLRAKISDESWQQRPGIEKVWYEHFKDLGIL